MNATMTTLASVHRNLGEYIKRAFTWNNLTSAIFLNSILWIVFGLVASGVISQQRKFSIFPELWERENSFYALYLLGQALLIFASTVIVGADGLVSSQPSLVKEDVAETVIVGLMMVATALTVVSSLVLWFTHNMLVLWMPVVNSFFLLCVIMVFFWADDAEAYAPF